MRTRKLWSWVVLLASIAFILQVSALAVAQDDEDDQGPAQDPPGRVGRLNYSQGSVSFRPAGEDDWVAAMPNRPMVTGDDLWADQNSRAEVHVGSTALRLGSRTGITFLDLDDHNTQIRLAQGSLIMRVRFLDDDDSYEVDTPNLAFTLLQPGTYRIDVSDDGSQTITTVWHGRGRVTGGGFTYTVVANQSATFTGNQDHLDYDLGQIPNRDDFDNWAFERDEHEDQADSANYVSREMTGYEDLDSYGDWSYVAGYGPCWRPRMVVAGWAPYRFGHWVYVGPWGWTWVEDEPWGFAPFHYGRWAYAGGGWYWVPGPVVVRPVWAPAMVAFVGGGPGARFAGGEGVGWFPLAPGEVYVPGYHVSRRYVNNVNITNTTVNVTHVTNVYNTVIVNRSTTINNITYVNQHVNNAVTVVSHDTFVNARPVGQHLMRVDQREIVAARVRRGVAVEPVRTSVVGPGSPVRVQPPVSEIRRPVVAVRTPPALQRPINERQAEAGGHLNEQMLVRPAGPARPAPGLQGGNPPKVQEGFRPFNQPEAGNRNAQPPENRNVQSEIRRPQPIENQNAQPPENRNAQPEFRRPQPIENQNAARDNGNAQPSENRNTQPEFRRPQPIENQNAQPPENRDAQSEIRRPQPIENQNQQSPQNRMQPTNRDFRQSQQEMTPPQSHPLVRPAPPVQQRTPQQEQQQEQKFNQWRQQRNTQPQPQPRQPQSRPAEQRQEKPPKKGR